MTVSGEDDGLELAENLPEPAAAIASGTTVGQVEGLIWSDATGIDVVCVEIAGAYVAVPIETDTWRDVHVVDLNMSPAAVNGAPRVEDLEASGGMAAVEMVSYHFSMSLSGPPPGPSPSPLPPWWDKGTTETVTQGDGPTPVVGLS
jgi:hypothetical protein